MLFFFFFNDTTTTEIYTLSLHDALPISSVCKIGVYINISVHYPQPAAAIHILFGQHQGRSEEHTSELQSHSDLVCRLLLEKKKEIHMEGVVQFIITPTTS